MKFLLSVFRFGLEANGQDDIIWYTATHQANGTYKLLLNLVKHKDQLVSIISIFTMSVTTQGRCCMVLQPQSAVALGYPKSYQRNWLVLILWFQILYLQAVSDCFLANLVRGQWSGMIVMVQR